MADIGRWNKLIAIEETDIGLLLDGGEHGLILCPSKYLPEDAEPGEEFEVFVYLDSKDRIIATTEQPLAQVGDFAALEVLSVHPKMGAFLEWGLAKDLLLPFAEQIGRVREGQKVVVAIREDRRSGRIIGSMKCQRYVDRSIPPYDEGQPVSLLICNETPMGYNAIVNNQYLGLLYHSEITFPIQIGETMEAYIKTIRSEGKIDLTLNQSGYGRVTSLTEDILEALNHSDGYLPLGDKSSPEKIRSQFGVSKKAFKQALGALYRNRKITFENEGIRLVKN
ncbi:MAG: S1-like domain-containing RNA-binding protein [Verrucomicrobiales bacterium]|nr:S1-like domain-containing RNA-binding protein [Verrucomicrobiales bacterium]